MANSQTFTLNIKALFDASDVKAKVGDLQNAFKNIKLPTDLQKNFDTSLSNLTKALNDFESRAAKGVSSKADAKGITNSIDTVIKEFSKVEEVVGKIKTEFGAAVDLSQFVKLDDATLNKIKTLKEEIKQLQQQISDVTSGKLDQVNEALNKIKSKGAKSGAEAAIKLFNEGNIEAALQKLKEVEAKQKQLLSTKTDDQGNTIFSYNEATRATATENLKAIDELKTKFQEAQSEVSGITSEINAKTAEIGNTAQQASSQVINGATQAATALTQEGTAAENARNNIVDLANGQAQFNREVDQVKSRIQYFFGLNNAINLVKRAIRGAVDTIKDLDKAMTETAVVTDFTVSDMWKQLPEYTKRANELGVTTQAAYEAATLYYQQGLNNDEVNALSVETLKMARIAGLDAAEATDRMTNALRGFNMELDTQSAQRVDDVYSELAANTASNVDEISTAMTKVASLAHSANMEFETTAAFLAQIIETTRESAETAGTALKTVVARFSEVKKLVDTNQLKGQDEEGQVVDVNKVSAALRTAGIDLNKYFLGEVGLDDIFMELASKWDSLTSVQQRYIATQAAGSRQQSRFIALMQDYARTQELVGKAYNAEGASARQFEKTQESLESKLNRLKNAWNEFLMGLTNNVMVKTFVDLLTDLLNLVNKITSAFGDGVGSILKWVTALGTLTGLRRLFTDGGLATQLIGSLMGNNPIANKIRAGMGLGTYNQTTQQYSGFSKEQLQTNRGPTIIGNFKNIGAAVKNFGSKAWTSAGALGSIFGLEGTAAGLAGVATALGAITAALGAAYGIYQLWLHNSAEGKLKLATKEAKKLQEQAQESQDQLKSLNNLEDIYKEKTEQVTNATSVADRQQAILDRNEAILDAIESDGTLAQYVVTERTDFGIELTVDEASLKNAIDSMAQEAKKAAIDSRFAEARVDYAEANVAEKKLRRMYQQQFMFAEDTQELSIEDIYERLRGDMALGGKQQSEAAELYSAILGERASADAKARIAYGEALTNLGASKDLTNTLMPVLADMFSKSQKQFTDSNLQSLLKLSDSALTEIADAYTGNADFDLENLSKESSQALERFANALGISTKQLRDQISAAQKERQEVKKGRQANIFEQALRSGHGVTQQFSDIVKGLDFDKLGIVSDIVTQAAGKVSENALQSLFDTLPTMADDQLQQLQTFFNSFSLDNPISALDQLNKKIAEVGSDSPFKAILEDIKATNAALFESSNLVQSFLLSESYESLSDSIEDATKENKKLTGKNIKEMAESCKELDALLDELKANFSDNIDEAQALADAINLIGEGALSIDQITNSLLAALGAGKSFESMIDDVTSWIEDFNEGTDLKVGTEHITSELDNLKKYVENWEFGNEPTENIYDHIFGKGKYKDLLKDYVSDTKTDFVGLEQELTRQIEHWSSLAENEGLGGIQKALSSGQVKGLSQIAGEGGEFFKWDLTQYTSTADAITNVASALGVGQEAAEAFILSWQTHMPLLRTEWNDLQLHDALTAFNTDLDTSNIVTQQELDALAAKFGKTSDEIKNAINDIRKEAENPIEITVVDWTDSKGGNLEGKDLINKFNETVGAGTKTTQYRGRETRTVDDYSGFIDGIKDVSRTVKNDLGAELNTLDFDTLNKHLTEALKLTPAQATEVANHISEATGQQLSKEIQIPIKAEDGSIQTEARVITASSADALQAGIDAAMQAANYALVAEELANQDVSTVGDNLGKSIEQGGTAGVAAVQAAINALDTEVTVGITYVERNAKPELATGGIVTLERTAATGGIIKSYAKGSENFHVGAGTALTGEEGPELIWNKDKGYAYVTGEHGPEFQNLHPGDRVFNAEETKKIFAHSLATGGLIDSYAAGGWKPKADKSSGGGGGGGKSGSGGKEKTPDEWKNELDWLYNLMEDIAELERDQKAIEEQYEDYLQDQSKTGKDLYNLLIKQLGNLYTQLNHQTFALEKREQEMREFMDVTNDQDKYLWYNWQDRTLEIDWDAIDQIKDEEQYKHVKELVDEAEDIQDKIDDADDAIMDITNQIQELENIWRDTFTDFEDRVYDAIVKSYQAVIDNYSELNDTLNNSNSQILDSLQKQISLQRQIRDNTKTEEEIADDEARLAYLRRDTSGGNDLEALQLEKELGEQRQNYEDTLVDQAISRLQEDNDAAAQQRQQQIDIMQAQLDYQSQNGEFNAYVLDLLTSAMGADGELLTNSDLVDLLKEQENWAAMSEVSKTVWDEELNGTFKEVAAFLLKQNAEENGTFYTALTAAVKSVSTAIGSYSQAMTKLGNQIQSAASGGGGGGGGSSGGGSASSGSGQVTVKAGNITGTGSTEKAAWGNVLQKTGGYGTIADYAYQKIKSSRKSGGLVSETGWGFLDGTIGEPEYVLNARQTDAFLKLADVLPQMMGSGVNGGQMNSFGSTYITAPITLESVSPDYDVERMADLLKEKLYDSGTYRNVNSLSFLR